MVKDSYRKKRTKKKEKICFQRRLFLYDTCCGNYGLGVMGIPRVRKEETGEGS